MVAFLLLLAMVFNMGAQTALKYAVNAFPLAQFTAPGVARLLLSPLVLLGGVLYAFSFGFYVLALSRGDLSRVSPASQGLTTLGVVIVSVWLFQEPLTATKVVGILLLLAGAFIVFR